MKVQIKLWSERGTGGNARLASPVSAALSEAALAMTHPAVTRALLSVFAIGPGGYLLLRASWRVKAVAIMELAPCNMLDAKGNQPDYEAPHVCMPARVLGVVSLRQVKTSCRFKQHFPATAENPECARQFV